MCHYVIIYIIAILCFKVVNIPGIIGGFFMRKISYDKSIITKEFLESRYKGGFSRAEVARELGFKPHTLTRIEKHLGVNFVFRSGRKGYAVVSEKYKREHAEQFQHFLDLHNQGMTFTQIASACGCSLSMVGKLFSVYGYSFDSEYKTKAAHKAVKGSKRTEEDLRRRAIGKELIPPKYSRWELLFRDFLISRGIQFAPSKAIGKYNVDFAIGDSIAVELFGGAFHSMGRAAARLHKRMEFLINNGWNVYIIWCLSNESTIFPGCFDDFIAFVKKFSGNKPMVGQYRVVWSDGDFVSSGSLEDDYLAAVKPATFRHNALAKYRAPRD